MSLYQTLLNRIPINSKKIVFVNFHGRGWGDNLKYIAQELLRQGAKYDLVWLVANKSIKLPKGIRAVELYSRMGRFELATARVIISNVKNWMPSFFLKKNAQFYIQTWHGDIPLKYIEQEAESVLHPNYLSATKADSKQTDLILSGSAFFSHIVRESFWYKGEILESGLPRNDIFFEKGSTIPQKIREQMGIPAGSAIALYAPTFRDHGEVYPLPNFLEIIDTLRNITKQDWVFVVRFHPNDQKRSSEIAYSSVIFNGSPLHDMQDLERAADLMITDYSSVMFDFVHQHKPVILFTPDRDVYRACCRDLRPLYEELPFIRVSSDSEMQKSLPLALSKDYICEVDAFVREKIQYFDDGHASERVVARINQVIFGNAK